MPSVVLWERRGVHVAGWVHTGPGHTGGDRASQDQLRGNSLGDGRESPAPARISACVRPAGIFFSSGPRWRAARQLTVRVLHSLGVGRAPVADKVLQELRCLTGQLDSYGGEWGLGDPLRRAPQS